MVVLQLNTSGGKRQQHRVVTTTTKKQPLSEKKDERRHSTRIQKKLARQVWEFFGFQKKDNSL